MKSIKLTAYLSFAVILFSLHSQSIGQQRKIPKNQFRFSDAVTGKPISEVLIIPLYYSAKGIFIAPEGPTKAAYRYYLDNPFVYRSGSPFILKTPKFSGLPLFPVLIGKGRIVEGILIVAPQYRPQWFEQLWQTRDIWNTRDIRDLRLTPISNEEWSLTLEQKLNPLTEKAVVPLEDFRFWGLYKAERGLYVHYDENERELVKSFLRAAEIETK